MCQGTNYALVYFICGESKKSSKKIPGDNFTSSKELENFSPDPYDDDKDLTQFCNTLFRNLSSKGLAYSYAWTMFKPWVVGYIFYTPENEQTRKLMTEFQQLFNSYKTISEQLGLLAASRDEIYHNLKALGSKNGTNGTSSIMLAIFDFILGNETTNSSEFDGLFFFASQKMFFLL